MKDEFSPYFSGFCLNRTIDLSPFGIKFAEEAPIAPGKVVGVEVETLQPSKVGVPPEPFELTVKTHRRVNGVRDGVLVAVVVSYLKQKKKKDPIEEDGVGREEVAGFPDEAAHVLGVYRRTKQRIRVVSFKSTSRRAASGARCGPDQKRQ